MLDTTEDEAQANADRRTPPAAAEPSPVRVEGPGRSIELALPLSVRAMLEPLVAALRWCAVVLGTALAAPGAVDGDIGLIVAMSVCLDVTAWRTMRPLRLGSSDRVRSVMSLTDAVLLGAAAGVNDGFESPFVFCLAVAAAVAAFGWGARHGVIALTAGTGAMAIAAWIAGTTTGLDSQAGWIVLLMTAVIVPTAGVVRGRLVETRASSAGLAGRLDTLTETNELLHVLNRVARTLPSSLDLQQTVATTREQLIDTFAADVIGILVLSEANETWTPLLAEGLAIPPTVAHDGIPEHLSDALASQRPILVRDLGGRGMAPTSGSGIYAALRTRGKIVGLLGIETGTTDRYDEHEASLFAGLAEALALSIDNARWFRRLRILGAEEERARIARDLHDRLGQWLTYISFELERIKTQPDRDRDADELDALHQDVQRAIDELRDTLRQMRTAVTETSPLSEVAPQLMARYSERTGIETTFDAAPGLERLPVPVENELLLILQEALNNVDKHANATRVVVEWVADSHHGHFCIRDDGDGFDHATGVRESAFGLVGIRERAEVIDAQLTVTSAPGAGTTIDVVVPREEAA